MKSYRLNILFILVTILVTTSNAQVFNNRYILDYTSMEYFNVLVKSDTIITIGFASDFIPPFYPHLNINKFSLEGGLYESSYSIDSSGYGLFPQYSATTTNSSHYIVGGGGPSGFNLFGFLSKWNRFTDKVETLQFEPVNSSITQRAMDIALFDSIMYSIILDRSSGNKFTARLVKLDTSLNILWEKHYSDPEWNYTPFSMIMDKDSNLIVGLQQSIKGTVTEEDNINSIVWKLDKEGELIDSFRAQNWTYGPNKILQSADGGYMFVDRIHLEKDDNGNFMFKSRIVKLDSELNYEWDNQVSGIDYFSELYNLKETSDGNYLAVGMVYDSLGSEYCYCGQVVKIDQTGDILWKSSIDFYREDLPFTENRFYDIIELESGGFVACGASYGINVDSFPQQAWLVRMDEKGQVVSQWDIPTESPSASVQVVPNPAQDLVRIRLEDEEILERYELYDQQGVIVQSGFPKKAAEVLDVSRLPAGVYYIRVNGQSVGKLVKQ